MSAGCAHVLEVEELALGSVRGAARRALEAHVDRCAECCEALAAFEGERALFARRAAVAAPPPELAFAIARRARHGEVEGPAATSTSFAVTSSAAAPRVVGVALAAGLAALRRSFASTRVVHGVLGAAACAGAFVFVADLGGPSSRARTLGADESEATAAIGEVTPARLASYAPAEPAACGATDPVPAAVTNDAPLTCRAAEARAVCEWPR